MLRVGTRLELHEVLKNGFKRTPYRFDFAFDRERRIDC
jgi:hypothetical protein